MKVIVAGFSKTGTKTMNFALTQLGYKVYDLVDHFWFHEKFWVKIFKDGGTIEDFKEMYRDVDAVVDVPACVFWEEISEAFPDAKIIFTLRDEESLAESLRKQIVDVTDASNRPFLRRLMTKICPTSRRFLKFFQLYAPFAFGHEGSVGWSSLEINKVLLRKRYQQHNAYFKQNAPKDRVLTFNIKDGWEPLCKFLGLGIPDTPFPWRNKGGKELSNFMLNHEGFEQVKKEAFMIVCCFVALVGVLLYCFVLNFS